MLNSKVKAGLGKLMSPYLKAVKGRGVTGRKIHISKFLVSIPSMAKEIDRWGWVHPAVH